MTGAADLPPPAVAAPVPVLNAANALTALRLVLVPVFVALVVVSEMTHAGWRVAACLAFAFASLTDFVDGWIARRFALVTSVGKVADLAVIQGDPIARPAEIRNVTLVFKDGVGYDAPRLTASVKGLVGVR